MSSRGSSAHHTPQHAPKKEGLSFTKTVLSGVLVVVLAAAALGAYHWYQNRHTTSDPLSISVQYPVPAATCVNGWIIPKPPPAAGIAASYRTFPPGGTLISGSVIGISLQAKAGKTVLLQSIGEQVITKRPIVHGYNMPSGCQGEVDVRYFTLNLDSGGLAKALPNPFEGTTVLPKPLPASVAENDPVQVYLQVKASEDVLWRPVLYWTSDGHSGSTVVSVNDGKPLEVTATNQKVAPYLCGGPAMATNWYNPATGCPTYDPKTNIMTLPGGKTINMGATPSS